MAGEFFDRILFNVILIFGLVGILFLVFRNGFKNRYKLSNKFLEDEMAANTARRREVEPEFYYVPDIDALPVNENAEGDILKKQSHAISCASKTMLHFPKKMSNLELKKAYGVANLEIITGLEENYGRYISALLAWAEALLKEDAESTSAITILENTVQLGSEFRKSYLLLADYYGKNHSIHGLDHLLERVTEQFEDEGIKRQLLQYIADKK